MKTIFVILLLSTASISHAKTYYFSSISGSDSRSSTQAQDSTTPWKTISKLNSFFSSIAPGDSVLFKKGEIFYGAMNINKSGTSGSPIVIGAYGTGNTKPVITTLVTVTDWVSKGNGIYESYNDALSSTLNIVLIDGVEQQVGRYPNLDEAIGGYLYFESHSGTTSITDNQLTSAINWTGGEVVIRQRRWKLDRADIISHSGTVIKNSGISGEPYDNYGYFIQNHIKTLDKFGEWYFNPSTKKLSIYFGTASPSSYNIQAATLDNGIFSNNIDNIIVTNVSIKGSNSSGLNFNSGANISVTNCDILFSGKDGVEINNANNFDIENCFVNASNNNGVDLGHSNNSTIRNNKINNTALFAGMGMSGEGTCIAITSSGDNCTIEYNEIKNTAYIPISFRGNYVTIKNNYIDSFCTVKDDGAGVYTYGASDNSTPKARKIIGNIINNGIGAENGTGDLTLKSAQGIYMDVNSAAVEINDNTIANTGRGLYLHSAHEIISRNNTFYNNRQQIYIKQDDGLDPIRNNVLANNILFTQSASANLMMTKSNTDDIKFFARFDSNYYARPLNDRLIISNSYLKSNGISVTQSMDLQSWKDKYGKDANSKKSAKPVAPYKLNRLNTANLVINGNFSSNVTGTSTGSCSVSLGTSGLLDGGYLVVNPSDRNSSVYFKIGSVTAGKNYILRFTVLASVDSTMAIGAFLRQAGSPYNAISPMQYRKVAVTRNEYELVLSPTSSESSASVVLKVDDKNKYYLDNVQLYEADATITNPNDSIRFEFNPTNSSKTVSLNGTYVDVRNKSYSSSIVLAPYTSAVLTKVGGGTSSQNIAPTISFVAPVSTSTFKAPSSILITNVVADVDGSISKVEYYNGSTLLHTEKYSPYTWTWSNVPAGNYTITAKAYDNKGLTTSTNVSFNVITQTLGRTGANSTSNPTTDGSYNNSTTLSVAPNPATTYINITLGNSIANDQKATISIIDISGKLVKNIPLSGIGNLSKVDVSALLPGMYFVKYANNETIINRKFVKIK